MTDEDLIEDQVCEAEAEMYEEELKEFYREATEKAKALREIFEENLIEKLFEENWFIRTMKWCIVSWVMW